ncbi:hypothetical protein, partial [Corynebacterium belfantii]|uniref:hypothetical protein n=1 Tax=Corynebacterium belfantii TaxID=2014537 RepID=UPI001A7EB823
HIQQPTGTPTATRLVRQNPHSDTQPHRQKRQYELHHTKMSQVGLLLAVIQDNPKPPETQNIPRDSF